MTFTQSPSDYALDVSQLRVGSLETVMGAALVDLCRSDLLDHGYKSQRARTFIGPVSF